MENRVVLGKNVVFTIAKNLPHKIVKVYILDDKTEKVYAAFEQKGFNVQMIKQPLTLDKKGIHQNIWAEITPFDYKDISDLYSKKRVVILDQITDPHNFGAIARTAYQFGFNSIVVEEKGGVSVTETVTRVSTGAIEFMDVVLSQNLKKDIDKLRDNGFSIYALDMSGELIQKTQFSEKTALLMGSEGKGIRYHLKDSVSKTISIPMSGKLDSINVSNAFAIAAWEVVRGNL
jgi:23S rRNA (guanosine2251-2'-O)-methyltransferase